MPDKPPNFLLITSDQQRADAVGYANPVVKTPNLDALAAMGVAYDRGYTCNPVCTPARVSILTGEYPSRHGCYTIGTGLPEDYPTIPRMLSAAGYFTAICGKAHFQPCAREPLGETGSFEAPPKTLDFDFWRSWSGPYYGFEHARLAIGHSWEQHAHGMHFGLWLRERGVDVEKHFSKEYTGYGTWDLPEEHHNSVWTADETIAALDRAAGGDRPFFIWSSFQDPHNPCVAPEPWTSMYRPEDTPACRLREGEFDDKPPFYAAMQENRERYGDPDLDCDKPWMCVRGIDFMDERKTRELTAVYYGMVSLMDRHVGRIVRRLEELGLMENTVIVFTSDHGDYLGNHGLWWKGLPAYEDAQRVPFLVVHPACRTRGARSSALQSLVDIGPSFLAAAGVEIPAGMQGIDQAPAWTDAARAARDWAMVEFRPTESPFCQRTLVTGRWKLVAYNERPYGELYDLDRDPDQYRNLWDDPAAASVRTELLGKLASAEMQKDGKLRPRVAWA